MKKYICEFVGTCLLVFFGCGVASIPGALFQASPMITPWAFGLVLAVLVYAIGGISGCHVNPAVSLAMLLDKRMSGKDFVCYVIAQCIGAFAGAALLFLIMNQSSIVGQYGMEQFNIGINGFEANSLFGLNMTGALITEVVLTFIFVFVIISVTANKKMAAVAGVVIGLALALVHFLGIPLTGTSVNPARSFGPALMTFIYSQDMTALGQLWVFVVAPLIGGALATCFYRLVCAKLPAAPKPKPNPEPKPEAKPSIPTKTEAVVTGPKATETPKPAPKPKEKPKPEPKPEEKK